VTWDLSFKTTVVHVSFWPSLLALPGPAIVQVGRSASLTPQLVEVVPGGRPMERAFDG